MQDSRELLSWLFPESKERAEFCPILVIGIGAFGHQVLVEVKAKLATLNSDLLGITAFLCVGSSDRDENERRGIGDYFVPPRSLEPWERFSLVGGEEEEEEDEIVTRGQAHQAFALHVTELRDRLVSCLNQITSVTVTKELEEQGYRIPPRHIEVYFIATLPEPTSGLLVDLAYLVAELIRGRDSTCHTTALLSIANAPPGSDSTEAQGRAYAALREISYHIGRRDDDDLEVGYGDLSVPFSGRPFHLCYLLDSWNEDGRAVNSQRDVTAAVANFVFSLVGTPLSRVLKPEPGVLDTYLGPDDLFAYSTLGLVAWTFPAEAIVTHCALRLAQEVVEEGLLNDLPLNTSLTARDVKDIEARLGYKIADDIPLDGQPTPQWRPDLKSGPEETWLLRLAEGYATWREVTYPQLCATLAAKSAVRRREIRQVIPEAVGRLVLGEPQGQSRAWRLLERLEESLHEERLPPSIPTLRSVTAKLQQAIAAQPHPWAMVLRGLAAASIFLLCLLTLRRAIETPDWMALVAVVLAVLGGAGLSYRVWKIARGRVESGWGEYQGALARLASVQIRHWQARLRQELRQSASQVIENEQEHLHKLKQKLQVLAAELAELEPGNLTASSAFEELVPVEVEYEDYYTNREIDIEAVTRTFLTEEGGLLEEWRHMTIDELVARLARRCRKEFADVSETYILEMLSEVWGPGELARRFEKLQHQVRTLLSTRSISAEQRSPEIVTCLVSGVEEAGIELLEPRDPSLRPCPDSGDKHHIFFVKVKHGFPLASIETIGTLRDAYRKVPESERESLHAWEEWETLPEIA